MSTFAPVTDYLRNNHAALDFVNGINQFLGRPTVSELPSPAGLGYGSHSCPIALALTDGVQVSAEHIVTTSKDIADAIGGQVNYAYGTFTIPAPRSVTEFVILFDEAYALEQQVAGYQEKMAEIAAATGEILDVADEDLGW